MPGIAHVHNFPSGRASESQPAGSPPGPLPLLGTVSAFMYEPKPLLLRCALHWSKSAPRVYAHGIPVSLRAGRVRCSLGNFDMIVLTIAELIALARNDVCKFGAVNRPRHPQY